MPNAFQPKGDMIVHSENPFNAEPKLDRLCASFVTGVRDFYVRCHGETPRLDEAEHRLSVGGLVATPLAFGMAELRARFPHATETAVMQCAGNRRADLQPAGSTSGDPWAAGAIGNAEWTGVRLAELLHAAGVTEDRSLHVAFGSADEVALEGEGRFRFGVSIPLRKAMSPEVLVAWAMNGEALPPEHGFPLRAVVPGYAGVRSAKWLSTVTVQDAPSDNHMQQRDYKLLPPDVTVEAIDWSRGVVIDEMPVNSAICAPARHARLQAGSVRVRGYAMATGRRIARVDVSPDGGRRWRQATLAHPDDAPWSWTLWEATLDLATGEHELVVRAWDEAGQTQPARPEEVWNCKGYLAAAWHRVAVSVA